MDAEDRAGWFVALGDAKKASVAAVDRGQPNEQEERLVGWVVWGRWVGEKLSAEQAKGEKRGEAGLGSCFGRLGKSRRGQRKVDCDGVRLRAETPKGRRVERNEEKRCRRSAKERIVGRCVEGVQQVYRRSRNRSSEGKERSVLSSENAAKHFVRPPLRN